MDLLDLFGIPAQEPEKQSKKTGKKTGKKDEKKKADKVENYKLPLTINLKGIGNITINDPEKEFYTEKEVLAEVFKKHRNFPPDKSEIVKEGSTYRIYLKDQFVKKGTVRFSPDKKIILYDEELPLILGEVEEESSIDVEIITAKIKEMFPIFAKENLAFSYMESSQNVIVTKIEGMSVTDVPITPKMLLFKISDVIDKECICIPDEALLNLLKSEDEVSDSDEKDFADEDEIEDGTSMPGNEKKPRVPVTRILQEYLEYYEDDMCLVEAAEEGSYLVVPKLARKTAEKTEVTYCVDGTTLSLLFTQYVLTPEMFGGRTEVKKEDIKKFLVSKGHKEFEYNELLLSYTEKIKMIIATLKGSSKGCDSHPLFSVQNGVFEWKAPKIPWKIFWDGYRICERVSINMKTEVLLDLYFKPDTGTYHWYVPAQYVTHSSTRAEFEPFLQSFALCKLIKVGQFHSHASFKAYFSQTDNCDEQVPGIYGVWGGFERVRTMDEVLFDRGLFVMRYVTPHEKVLIDTFSVFAERDYAYEEEYAKRYYTYESSVVMWCEKVRMVPIFNKYRIMELCGIKGALVIGRKEIEFMKLCGNIFIHGIKEYKNEYYVLAYDDVKSTRSNAIAFISAEKINQMQKIGDDYSYGNLIDIF